MANVRLIYNRPSSRDDPTREPVVDRRGRSSRRTVAKDGTHRGR